MGLDAASISEEQPAGVIPPQLWRTGLHGRIPVSHGRFGQDAEPAVRTYTPA